MAYLTRDGVRLYYEVHGEGLPVLLTHGYAATNAMWRDQIAALADRYQVIVWDLRGHGESDAPDDPALYSVAHAVDDIAAVLDACGQDAAVIGGLSLGGYLSLAFQLAHPQRVRALVLCDTGPGFKQDAPRASWNAWAEKRALRFERDGLAALGKSAEVLRASHRGAMGLAHAARGMLVHPDGAVIHALPDIDRPTLVIVGADDEPFLAGSDYMASKIRGAAKAVIPSAGHAANLDNPAAFNAALEAFLAQLDQAPTH